MKENKKIKVGIGFATGRKSFQRVLRTYISSWNEYGLVDNDDISLNLFIAYDLAYNKTKITDYTNVHPDLVSQIDSRTFIGTPDLKEEVLYLSKKNVVSSKEASAVLGRGYAGKRNAILYYAIKNQMDYLIFLDDDEYPLAVTNTKNTAIWGGQHVLSTHLKNIDKADITHGHHCGYISPIPCIKFNKNMSENDFRTFIEAISNDIINWDTITNVMKNGGVTYADTDILTSDDAYEVKEVNHTKFISGANLCINLKNPNRVFPFYNPPGARGEDTFLSTCLTDRKVLKVPCYTFHDGFSTYNNLLSGVLPTKLKFVEAKTEAIKFRFYKACIGWIRYKPLLLYITQRKNYHNAIKEMKQELEFTLPQICRYFHHSEFYNVLPELEKYNLNVEKHYNAFLEAQKIWKKIMNFYAEINTDILNSDGNITA